MDFLGGADGLSKLSNLLEESREAQHGRDDETVPPVQLGNTRVVVGKPKPAVTIDSKAIWLDDEIPLEDAIICRSDGRPAPRYEFSYKQTVGTEDTFLGLNGKSASSSDCNSLVIKVHFPGETMRDIQLDVTTNRIKAESKALSLFTYLPVNVNSEKGVAKFDSIKHVLTITLPIINELDNL